MCCCGKPNINGTSGYSWDGKSLGVYPVSAPETDEKDTVLFDEPGRCGGVDSHSHHYRIVTRYGSLALLVRHGGGTVAIQHLSNAKALREIMESLDSNGRYWIMNAIYHAQSNAAREAKERESGKWQTAAAEKRIKTRKYRGSDVVRVWIADKLTPAMPERGK